VRVVPSQPSDFKGEAKSETSILLSWVAPPQSSPDNQITGYELVYRRPDHTEEVRRTNWPNWNHKNIDLQIDRWSEAQNTEQAFQIIFAAQPKKIHEIMLYFFAHSV
jgi:hypothetical protein